MATPCALLPAEPAVQYKKEQGYRDNEPDTYDRLSIQDLLLSRALRLPAVPALALRVRVAVVPIDLHPTDAS